MWVLSECWWERYHPPPLCSAHLVGWLVVFYIPSTARSFRDGIPIYCPLQRTWSSIFTPFPQGIEPRTVAWQSITLPLRHASSNLHTLYLCDIMNGWYYKSMYPTPLFISMYKSCGSVRDVTCNRSPSIITACLHGMLAPVQLIHSSRFSSLHWYLYGYSVC